MSTKQHNKQGGDPVDQARQQCSAAIQQQVLRALGQPGDPHQVKIYRLWGDHYRVNVLLGEVAAAKVAHSYFLVTDSDGKILTSTPTITREY